MARGRQRRGVGARLEVYRFRRKATAPQATWDALPMRRSVAAAVVLLAVVAVAVVASRRDDPPLETKGAASFERFAVRGQPIVLARPRTITRKIVIYVHGATETAENAYHRAGNTTLLSALLRGGFAVVTDHAHGDNWGNPASDSDYAALVPVLRRRGLTDVYVVAASMGGLNALQLLSHVRVKAWAGIFPVCDLSSVYARGRFTAAIRAAYADHASAALRSLSPVRPDWQRGLAMRFWASPADTYVPKAANTDVCADAARAHGAHVTVTTTTGEHGDLSNFDAAGVLHLFDGAH